MLETAFLDVRVLPWRPRARVMDPDTLRDNVDPFIIVEDNEALVIGLVLWLVIVIAAPLVVLLLAVLLLSVEVPIALALGVVLLLVRFTGIVPWSVLILEQVAEEERRETYRSLRRAVRRIRELNADRRVRVRWAWA